MSNKKAVLEFCNKYGITEDQFYGRQEIKGNLFLSSVTSLLPGFNPTVGGDLYLSSVKELLPGFNPTVSGWLDLRSITSLIPGFNPTVSGWLDLRSITSLIPGFNPTVGGWLNLSSVTDFGNFDRSKHERQNIEKLIEFKGGKYIKCDGRFSEVISKKGKVWKLKDLGKNNEYYLITDGNNNYSHGETIKQAKEDLIYKCSSRNVDQYKNLDKDKKFSFQECITMYRSITGSCSTGVKNFITTNNIKNQPYSINEIIHLTTNNYGHQQFLSFFNI